VSWGAVADAVGHCLLVFAFAPVLVALPRWLYFEATNPLNLEDPIVLAFLPARAGVLMLNTFLAGAVQGVVAGIVAGALVSAWAGARGRPSTRAQEILLGAACGTVAACLMVGAVLALEVSEGRPVPSHVGPIAFEIATGAVCGVLAVPTALRLLAGQGRARRRRPSSSAPRRSSRRSTPFDERCANRDPMPIGICPTTSNVSRSRMQNFLHRIEPR
jgi:hypothetical protein